MGRTELLVLVLVDTQDSIRVCQVSATQRTGTGGRGGVQQWATGYNSEDEESRTAGWGIQLRSAGLGWESVQALLVLVPSV